MNLISTITLAAVVVVSAATAPSPPAAAAIALTKADLPTKVSFVKKFTGYVTSRQLNGDTVPAGLSVRQLRNAGFKGMYSQSLTRQNDNNPYGYPWLYIALANTSSAHRVYSEWVAGTKEPFNFPLGASRAANECRLYRSVISSQIIGLICRVRTFVVFGHFLSRAGVESLMRLVAQHAAHVRP